MSHMIYDVVVVGAGVEGSATAYSLAKKGKKTLLLEQFPLPHSRGSSHGQSRITRKAYPEEFYTEMMHEATDNWRELEREAGWEIFRQSGFLALGTYKGEFLEDNANSLRRNNAKFEYLTPVEFRRRYPMLSFPDNFTGIVDPDGGILRADKALRAFQTMFQKYGGHLVDGAKVTNIRRGSIVTLETASATYKGRSVVICPGPWASSILRPLGVKLPLETVRIDVLYWREQQAGSHHAGKLATFYQKKACGPWDIYGLPSEEYPGHVKVQRISVFYWRVLKKGAYDPDKFQPFSDRKLGVTYGTPNFEYPGHVKICLHHGPVIDPESRDQADDKWVLDLAKKYVGDHFPFLEATPSVVETCIYTNTPDKHPVLDYVPGSRNIVFGVGFSGHGFKLSPVIGKVLGELACGQTPSYNLSPFSRNRFPAQSNL